MPRVCRACTHGERSAIDLAIATRNGSIRAIAARYGLSKTSLFRHAADHVAQSAVRAAESQDAETHAGISAELRTIADKCATLYAKAEKSGDVAGAGRMAKEWRETVVYLGKTIGLFQAPGAIVVNDNRTQFAALDQLSVEELRALLPAPKNVTSR